jgi:hypothetical protein
MDLLPWKWFDRGRDTLGGRSLDRRHPTKLSVGCEALDGRQLLSTVVPAGTAFSVPSATVVANAAAILESDAPRAFAQFQSAMARAEQQSNINPADVTTLAQDEAVVDQDLTAASASGLNNVQDWVDNAFTYESAGIRDVRRNLVPLSKIAQKIDQAVSGAPAVFDASSSNGSSSPVNQLIDQIKVVATQAKVTRATQAALNRSYAALNEALGPHPYVSLGPGANNVRDPLVVYYDAQVNNFTAPSP